MLIYKVTNKANGKCYIGKTTKSLSSRWTIHLRDAKANRYRCHLHRAIRKYGTDSFVTEVLDQASTKKELNNKERFHISANSSFGRGGYNLTTGGDGAGYGNKHTKGRKHTEEAKRKIAIAHVGMKPSIESRMKMSLAKKGKQPSLETRQKYSEAGKKRWARDREKLVASLKLAWVRRKQKSISKGC